MNPSNAKGIIFMLLASLFFTINDNFMKFMTEVEGNIFYIFELIFIRGVVATLFLLFCLIITNQINFKKMFTSKRSYIRGCFEALTMIFFFIGVVTMPLAEVYTLLNVSPIFITTVESIVVFVTSNRNSNCTLTSGSVRNVLSAVTCSNTFFELMNCGVTDNFTPTFCSIVTESPGPEVAAAVTPVPEKKTDV